MGQQNSYMTLIGVHEMHNIMYEVCRCVGVSLCVNISFVFSLFQTRSRIEKLMEMENWRLYNKVGCPFVKRITIIYFFPTAWPKLEIAPRAV